MPRRCGRHILALQWVSGTDVAREAADIVLLDDNFATIVGAIEQGRAVYQNIRKFMTYILASNVPEVVPFLAMVAFKIPPALTIMQILAVDLGTDMIPALALGAERPEAGSMQQPPRSPKQPLLDRSLLIRAYLFLGPIEAVIAIVGFLSVWWGYGYTFSELQAITPALLSRTADAATVAIHQQAMTLTLAAIVACQVGNVFACRSERVSLSRLGFFSNRLIWLGIAIEWLLIVIVIFVPPLQQIFATAPLALEHWVGLLLCPPLLLVADEWQKRWMRKRKSIVG
jgi:magnesium-transporting ATPase (P-type)